MDHHPDTLQEPLLVANNSAMKNPQQEKNTGSTTDWNQEYADRASVYAPADWKLNNSEAKKCHLKYDATRNLLLIVSCDDNEEVLDAMDVRDIIGAELELSFSGNHHQEEEERPASSAPENVSGSANLHIYVYPRRDPSQEKWLSRCGIASHKQIRTPYLATREERQDPTLLGPRYAHHRHFQVVPCLDFYDVTQVVKGIRSVAQLGQFDTDDDKKKKYLVLVNPKSGLQKGKTTYETTIKPMLNQAGVEHEVIFTTHQHHATEFLATDNRIQECDGVIAVGGDGILNEMLNGIQSRSDAKQLLDRLGIGIVACGTSNGLVKSLLHACQETYGVLESVFLICKGQTQKLDLSSYQVQDKQYTSFLTFSYGYIADLDIESECIRFCGILRNDIWGAWRIAKLRTYPVRFSYLPPSSNKNNKIDMPALTDPVPSDWVTIEDDFVVFWAAHVSHAASNTHNSPMSTLQDGVFQVFVVRAPISRLKLAQIALGFEGATHVDCPDAEFYECVAYRLEPLSEGSFNDLDGEVIESGPVQGHVVPSAMNVYCGKPTSSAYCHGNGTV